MSNHIPGKVSAVYANEQQAKSALKAIMNELSLSQQQVSLVPPNDVNYDQKIEPNDRSVGRTLITNHINFGLGGALLGLAGGIILGIYGPQYTQSSPGLTVAALVILGLFVGLLMAGLISLRPDQDAVVNETRQATQNDKWVVIIHTANHQQNEHARTVLEKSADSVSASF